tara:strand:+ start:546 stop:1163 length:618 start_codon:yes stop_codon:yes gene_type:complete
MIGRLPELLYNFSSKPIDPDFLLVKNIWRRAQVLVEFRSELTLFTEVTVGDGEKPEDMAVRFYNNPFYNWTILVVNDIVDYYAQWPRSSFQLQSYIKEKYTNEAAVKHHVTREVKDANGNIIVPAGKVVASNFQVAYYDGSTTVTANPVAAVTNSQYETELNSKKQQIQIVRPELIEDFVETYHSILSRGKITTIATAASDITMQ